MASFPDPATHKDSNGDNAPLDLIGLTFEHTVRKKEYEVIGFCWIGDTDQWGVLHSCVGDPVYCRSLRNFTGMLPGGSDRFERVV